MVGLSTAVVCGFVWFVMDAQKAISPIMKADGIVALTGGNGRVETALRLLKDGHGHLLLISGVDPHTTLRDIAPGIPSALLDRVTLGQQATSTAGNGAETAAWARHNGLHSLIVVTAGYHMRRAMLMIHRAAPEIRLEALPVQPPAMQRPYTRATLRLLVLEYGKFLLALIGPSWAFRHTVDAG
ncbi:hypothetical protein AA0472_2886 [Acetobacter estunensis NRIC 0472]|uniref:YdcF family protein n=2 Tax=Acetobacter estunensis TaxID=104097 RepID=A0A967B6S9_9PROT|nr:YdcF family protein [Acetobacter estunensis]NHO53449.1 YdcF family protein [Acetobacter estunensis]GBQ29031.1 hypothetical protein AA0472_2886 [Acetobacter estunensis NRIC 0472]